MGVLSKVGCTKSNLEGMKRQHNSKVILQKKTDISTATTSKKGQDSNIVKKSKTSQDQCLCTPSSLCTLHSKIENKVSTESQGNPNPPDRNNISLRAHSTDSEDSCVCTSSWECKKHPGIPISELSDTEENRQVIEAMLASVRSRDNSE